MTDTLIDSSGTFRAKTALVCRIYDPFFTHAVSSWNGNNIDASRLVPGITIGVLVIGINIDAEIIITCHLAEVNQLKHEVVEITGDEIEVLNFLTGCP